ncbi:hypothetical protein ACJ41O_014781 [Fusarium nematophilum]
MADTKDASILIIGAGTFGLSTALDLSLNGYSNITVLDRGEEIPSPHSAGCDLNKIVRAEYEDPFYVDLALEAIAEWKTPYYAPYYAERGLVWVNSPGGSSKASESANKGISTLHGRPEYPPGTIKQIKSGREIRSIVPQLKGRMDGWTGYFNKYGGYARAGRAMAKIYSTCKERGVRFVLGESEGNAETLLFDGKRCKGVRTKSGREHLATHMIVCLGAHVGRLIPSITDQITAKAWAVAHIQLTPEQARSMADIPVINCRDLGFFFEPDAETGLLKIAAHRAGLTNFEVSDHGRASLPAANGQGHGDKSTATHVPAGQIPKEDEEKIAALIAATMPQFSSLPLIRKFICWCGDTTDSNYIIDFVPDTEDKSLMVFSGDSGHAFKMLPIAGRWARDVLEKGEQRLDRWKWKGTPQGKADEISWRFGDLEDVKDVQTWVGDGVHRASSQVKSKL